MNYIIFDKESLRVYHILSKPPVDFSDTLDMARCEEIPEGDFGYFTVYNLATKTEKYTEVEQNPVTKTDEEGNEYESYEEIEVEKTREYKVCDLVGHKREIVDKRTRSQKINDLIREKYSQDAVEAIFANYLKYLQGGEEKEEKWLTEYEEFQNYREACKQKVDAEGGGENG